MKRLIPLLLPALTGAAIAGAALLLLAGAPGTHPDHDVCRDAEHRQRWLHARGREHHECLDRDPQVYRRDAGGVVAIRARTASGEDSGTGIVLNDSGLILTNNHVVSEASAITVSPGESSSSTRTATLVGADPDSDLALIKVDPSGLGLKALKFADSGAVQVGDPVYAISNPYGLDETLTRGIVSALGREIQAPNGAEITGAIQTDAGPEPRQLRRAAAQRRGRSHRDQLPDRQRPERERGLPGRQHRCRLRDLRGHGRPIDQGDRIGSNVHAGRHRHYRHHRQWGRTESRRRVPLR